ncbi:PREDICTED: endoplasmic reticulum-Golgi intermediate compartment protein 2-like isoform X1 [Branchiostoma belcheri]|uniref:Endoplasmic reticulum-Golgi intermediate compartment protein 2-like isoform X1 n=1 Tax=Branchiostoma belcheri TaxID=7741 RepID=A0A6P4YR64_BRABE|nr:PREDICTED: endoplasmic reticulum-Golgi intermediate compartment protein 2-like isoform X1 [Branchiostoma belcheri]
MRRLNRKQTLKVVKEMDAFPKIPESYVQTSTSGATVSILSFVLIAILVISELIYYSETNMKYEYNVDTELESKLKINLDVTVAMKCESLGADVLDLTGNSISTQGSIKEDSVFFDMTPQQKRWQRMVQTVKSSLDKEKALQHLLFKTGFSSKPTAAPVSSGHQRNKPEANACRFHGTIEVNKVAGNFHITAGRSIPHPRGHAHLSAGINTKVYKSPSGNMLVVITSEEQHYNFSHRIDHLSFGDPVRGIINPLDGEEKVTQSTMQMFQYFIQIVPTRVNTRQAQADTGQFAVTERERVIDHGSGSHGVAGIFFKYDLTSIMVKVTEERQPFSQLLIRLCGIVGGIFATSGMLHGFIGFLVDTWMARVRGREEQFSNHMPTPAQLPPQDIPLQQLDREFPEQESPLAVNLISTDR